MKLKLDMIYYDDNSQKTFNPLEAPRQNDFY